MPDLSLRYHGQEMMDDANAPAELLRPALMELPTINRLLGGYRATFDILERLAHSRPLLSLRILDVGTGIGDYPVEFVRWGNRRGIDVHVVGIDVSRAIIDFARENVLGLNPNEAERIDFQTADARLLPFSDSSFDIVTAALFFHHLSEDDAVLVLRQMSRVARLGILVNDLHRSALAYYGIRAWTSVLRYSTMVKHDGPLSVRRGFRRHDLARLASLAELSQSSIHWHWAFRWTLTDLVLS